MIELRVSARTADPPTAPHRSPRVRRPAFIWLSRRHSLLSSEVALDPEQHLLAVRAHAENNEERDRGRLAVEPHANDGAVEDQAHNRILGQRAGVPGIPTALHLAPRPAHGVLDYCPVR